MGRGVGRERENAYDARSGVGGEGKGGPATLIISAKIRAILWIAREEERELSFNSF